jgi:hypothetical protein
MNALVLAWPEAVQIVKISDRLEQWNLLHLFGGKTDKF